ncbi:MAG: M36 family metallopeptidase [Actinomycetota bacterium]|nr:M36 family metallopeptidase [Actinomycetota bacterium]
MPSSRSSVHRSRTRRRHLQVAAVLAAASLGVAALVSPGAQALGGNRLLGAMSAAAEEDFSSPVAAGGDHGLDDLDNRLGSVAPSEAARSAARALGARVEWNRYGTPASLIKNSGYLATGLGSDPVKAARTFISNNKALFRLTSTGVNNLRLLNDSKMADSRGHAVLFRQTFGGMPATEDGLITVGVVDGKVAYVSSSAVGDGNAPAAADITAKQAWEKAAANVGLGGLTALAAGERGGWQTFSVEGLDQVQRARLVALPTPKDGVRPAYETIVYNGGVSDAHGHPFAYTVFIDAQNGNVLYRTNRLNHLDAGVTPAMAPTTGTFSGTYSVSPLSCGPRHEIATTPETRSITVAANATVPGNDIVVNILQNDEVVGGPGDTVFSPEVSTYDNGGDPIPPANYAVQVCPFSADSSIPPYSYTGFFVTSDVFPDASLVPMWKYFLANPPLNGDDTDTRIVGCFTSPDGQNAGGTLPPGCQREEGNLAARAPWDVDPRTNSPSFTTRGNAARTAEAWFSPFTPAEQYSPIAPDRKYIFPWRDIWRNNKCSPTVFAEPPSGDPRSGRNDIDASTTSLFANHNRMHDWSYFLGFTEDNFNLQFSNFGNTGPERENDPEVGNAQAGAVVGGFPSFTGRDNANQITLNDGIPGITNMYLWQPLPAAFYASCTDGDFDQSVIGHEYTHAISNRMVGGPDAGLQSSSDGQARAMGESYSDLTAVEYLNEYNYVPTNGENPFAVGPYVTGNKQVGIRNYAMNNSPLNFSDVQGYDGSGVRSPHDDGEIWSAVNFDIRQAMIAKYNGSFPAGSNSLQKRCADGVLPADKCPGNRRWMQTVFDAYLLMPSDVSMLGARDAYLAADLMRYGGTRPGPDNQKLLWQQFAKRGFGQFAQTGTKEFSGTDDPQPIPSFESPRQTNEATVNWRFVDENGNAIENAQVFVGDYEGRVTPIADTDPATALGNQAKFVPGTYDFVIQAPGRGLTRLTRTFDASQTVEISRVLLTNWASEHNGATITGDGVNLNGLIDDTEATNFVSGKPGSRTGGTAGNDAEKVRGRQVTVDLPGGVKKVGLVKVSALLRSGAPCSGEENCDPQDNSQNRFSALRQFAIETCRQSATTVCTKRSTADAAGPGFTRIFTSAPEAFPASVPRPLAPSLILREFDVPDVRATHVRLVVLSNQCTGNSEYHGDQDNDPNVHSDCRTQGLVAAPDEAIIAPQDTTVRAAELQVFSAGG